MWSHVPHRVVRTDTSPIGEVGADHCYLIKAGNRDEGMQDQRPLWFWADTNCDRGPSREIRKTAKFGKFVACD